MIPPQDIELVQRMVFENPRVLPELGPWDGKGGKGTTHHLDDCRRDRDGKKTTTVIFPNGNMFDCARNVALNPHQFIMREYAVDFPTAHQILRQRLGLSCTSNVQSLARVQTYRKAEPPQKPKTFSGSPGEVIDANLCLVENCRQGRPDGLTRWLADRCALKYKDCRHRKAIDSYHVGADRQGRTIFWYLDPAPDASRHSTIWCRKSMLYKPDGHRDREAKYPVLIDGSIGCFFGEHLLWQNLAPNDLPAVIVESEKTALAMACKTNKQSPGAVYIATGGLQNLRRLKDRPILRNRRVTVSPDNEPQAWELWGNIAQEKGWEITEETRRAPEHGDLADLW